MKNKIAMIIALRTAIITFMSGWVYSEFNSAGLAAVIGMLMIYVEINFASIYQIHKRLPSEQDMEDIKQVSKDMAELKKHMDWK